MKSFNQITYTDKIKWRIRGLWLLIIAMLAYMVVIGEIGGGDSRIMTDLAERVSRIIFFGGLGYVVYRLIQNKKLLKDRSLLKEKMWAELDERNQYLHDKSGGIVFDILLLCLLFTTLTTSLFNMPAFYTSAAILAAAVLLKITVYLIFNRIQKG